MVPLRLFKVSIADPTKPRREKDAKNKIRALAPILSFAEYDKQMSYVRLVFNVTKFNGPIEDNGGAPPANWPEEPGKFFFHLGKRKYVREGKVKKPTQGRLINESPGPWG